MPRRSIKDDLKRYQFDSIQDFQRRGKRARQDIEQINDELAKTAMDILLACRMCRSKAEKLMDDSATHPGPTMQVRPCVNCQRRLDIARQAMAAATSN